MVDIRCEVLVVGGGTTGCCAALAAARGGARTLLVEANGFLGGNAANGLPWLGFHHAPTGRQVVTGIPVEIVERLQSVGGASRMERDPICGSLVTVDSTRLKLVLADLLSEAGVEVRLHTMVSSAEHVADGWTVGIANASGEGRIRARFVIDATDIGAVAIAAGAKGQYGRRTDGKPQVASAVVRIGDVDVAEMIRYFRANPLEMRPFRIPPDQLKRYVESLPEAECFVLGAFPKLIAAAKSEGASYPRDRMIGVVDVRNREFSSVCSRVEGVDPRKNLDYSKAEVESLRQSVDALELFRRNLPGFGAARIVSSGHTIGLRETFHVLGDYTLTGADLMEGTHFPDTIAHGGYHLDIHSPDDPGLKSRVPPVYCIPFRSLLPVGLDDLLVAGRAISATHEAQASVRVIPILGSIGEAAGRIAAHCLVHGIGLRETEALADVA